MQSTVIVFDNKNARYTSISWQTFIIMVYRNWFFYIEGGALKKIFILVCCLLFVFATANICFAHPGGTDGKGGHYVGNSGKYHYHHGESAHQHPNGVCPYEIEGELSTEYDEYPVEEYDIEEEIEEFRAGECTQEGCPVVDKHHGHIIKESSHTEEATYEYTEKETSFFDGVIKPMLKALPTLCIWLGIFCVPSLISNLIKKRQK